LGKKVKFIKCAQLIDEPNGFSFMLHPVVSLIRWGKILNFNAQRMNEPNGFFFMLHPLVSSILLGKN